MRWSLKAAAITFAVTCVAAGFGWTLANQHDTRASEHVLDENLALAVPGIESEISRFSTLIEVLKQDPRVIAVHAHPDPSSVAVLNTYLTGIREQIGASEYSILDEAGTVVASSSWNAMPSLIGQNFAFRPYFRDAMATGRGRFFAFGLNTGIPGYYMASRIDLGGVASGVVVVKVDFSAVEASWRDSGISLALADREGVVFLSSQEGWKYRPLYPLSDQVLASIAENRQYDGIDLAARPPLFSIAEDRELKVASLAEDGLLFRVRRIGDDGLRVIAARPFSGPGVAANMVALLIVLIGLVVSGSIFIYRQRGLLVRLKSAQSRLLEKRVEERTRELAVEVAIRRETEKSLYDAEEGLVQAAKLAALGQMSAALAHEVSQPVTALAALLTAAERRLEAGEYASASQLVERARSLTRRIQHIVRHLRSFAKKSRGEGVRIRVSASIAAALELAETRAREIGVSIAVTDRGGTVEVFGDPVRLEQVLINLMLNALDAVAGRERREVGIGLSVEGGVAAIRVWDSGPGIPEEIGERLVEPFFTTKSGEDGLGLGLSISQSILADFGAEMRFVPRPGGGTVCEVRLPLAVPEPEVAAAE